MPTYEYECQKCGYRFEQFQSITAEPLQTCPREGCGGRLKRLIGGGSGFLFKGSGFYATDYRSEGYQKAAKAEKEGGSSGGEKSESKSSGKSGSTAGAGED